LIAIYESLMADFVRSTGQMAVRVVAIDWSGAKLRAGKKIWLAELTNGQPTNLITGRNRAEILEYLVSHYNSSTETVIGIDFAFSFPSWFVEKIECCCARDVWRKAVELGEQWLQECSEPFWGRPGKKNPGFPAQHQFRHTDRESKIAGASPKSIFQIGGAGAVGTGSIRGMWLLDRLSSVGFSVWPFDSPRKPLVLEIWPRALTGKVNKSNGEERSRYISERYPRLPEAWQREAAKSEDAFDAIVSAVVMHENYGQIVTLLQSTDSIVLLEGMIWVPENRVSRLDT
jgi:hypothetical protein